MRIVAVTWSFPEPSEPFVLEKLVGMADRGHDVHVVAESLRDANRVDRRLTLHCLPFGRRPAFPGLDPDVVHFEWATGAVHFLDVIAELRCPTVVSCHGSDLQVAPLDSPWLRGRLRRLFAAVDRVHCVSQELADLAAGYGARPEQLVVSPMGIDWGYFAAAGSRGPADDGVVRILSAGRLHWRKGYDSALEAVRLLGERGHAVRYTIAGGDDGGGDEVRLAVHDLGLEKVAFLAGHLDRAAYRAAFADADVFLLSSVSEGVSVAALEAMASGLPAVATDVGGMGEAITDGEQGFVVRPRDPRALADALEKLVVDPPLRHEMGRRAADHAHRFDVDMLVDRLVAVYEDVVDQTRRRRRPDLVAVDGTVGTELVSVVMPVRDAARTIDEQLRALAGQDYGGPWELVVSDNGSRDETLVRVRAWTGRIPDLRVVSTDEGGVAQARNVGVRSARGARVVMCDADDVVGESWLRLMATALEEHQVAVPQLERRTLNPQHPGFWAGPRALDLGTRVAQGHRTMVPMCGGGFQREVFDRLGGFDVTLARGEDMDFGWRAIAAGYLPRFVPGAVMHYRARRSLWGVARQAFADGLAGAQLFARHRRDGMPRATVPEALHEYRRLLQAIPRSLARREDRYPVVYDLVQRAGRVIGSVRRGSRFL